MIVKEIITDSWQEYQTGKEYKYKLNYYNTVDKNEDFYAGDQWRGIKAKGMPTPVFNIFKRVINFFISWILSSKVKAIYTAEYVGDIPEDDKEQQVVDYAQYLTNEFGNIWEYTKMDRKMAQLLLDGALSGDMCIYTLWDKDYDTGQSIKGRIEHELVDGAQVFFGNPNCREVEKQPYIIIAFRKLVSELVAEAKANGNDIQVSSDKEYNEQAGSRGKIELDEEGKAICLLRLWKKDGIVYAKKETRNATIRDEWSLKIKKYPIAWGNWDVRKNSQHGQALGSGLIPNQIYINQMFAMVMIYWQLVGFPKVVYDKTKIDAWSNKVGGAIGVTGDITNVAKYMNPSTISGQIMDSIEKAISYTKEMLGLTDAFAGDVRPENTSAIVVITKQASIPLESVKRNLYDLVEDQANIDKEFMLNYYGKRKIKTQVLGKNVIVEVDFDKIAKERFTCKVEVGASSYWSEAASSQMLDNLLQWERIDFIQYLERIPEGMVPQKKELIEDLKTQDKKNIFLYEMMAQFMEQLPPEEQQRLQSLDPEQMEQEIIEMMMESSPIEGNIQ